MSRHVCEHSVTSVPRTLRTSGFLRAMMCGIYASEQLCLFPYCLLYTTSAERGRAMTFDAILDQALTMLQRRGRVTYRTLKRQFQLDDAALDDLTHELIAGQRLAAD